MLELLSAVKVKGKGTGQVRGRSMPVTGLEGRYDVVIDDQIHSNLPESMVELVSPPDADLLKKVIR